MAARVDPLILGFDSARRCWTEGEVTARVRSLSEPDRAVPLTARLICKPDILDYSLDAGEQDCFRARVRLRPEAKIPADFRAHLTILADPAMEVAAGVMKAAGFPVLLPFKDLRAQVEVHLLPYSLEVRAFAGDRELSLEKALCLDGDARTSVRLEAAVYAVDAQGQLGPQSLPLTVEVRPSLQNVRCESKPRPEGGLNCTLTSEQLVLHQELQAGSLTLEATLPEGHRVARTLTVLVQALRVQLQLTTPASIRITPVRSLESCLARLFLKVMTADGRGVQVAYKLLAALGSFDPSSGRTDEAGEARTVYHPPAPAEAADSPGAWPRIVTLKALLGPQSVGAAQCDVTLTFPRQVKIVVEKVGFSRVEKELEVPGPESCRLSLVALARDESVAVAHASVSGSGFAPTTSDAEGNCTLDLGGGGSRDLGKLTLTLEEGMASLQKRVLDGLKEGSGGRPTPDYSDAQTKLSELVEKELVKRLAREEATSFEITRQVMLALAASVRVMNLARSCFLRRFGRLETSLRATLEAILTAIWECWAGDVFTALLTRLAKAMAAAAAAIARALGSLRLVRWAISGVVASVNAMRTTFVNFYMRFHNKVLRLFNETNVPSDMRRRLASDPAQGPIPLTPGAIVDQVRESLDDALRVLRGKVDSLRQALQGTQAELATNQAAIREVQELIARQRVTPGMDMGDLPMRLKQLQAQTGPLEERLARVGTQLEKAEVEFTDGEARSQTVMVLAQQLDMLVELGCGLLNVTFNIMVASLLAMIALLLTMVTRGLRRAGARTVVMERLAKLLEDMVGNLLAQEGTEQGSKSGQGAVQKLRNQLLAAQRNMAGPVLAATYEVYKDWPEVDAERFRTAVRYYYEQVERNELLTQESEVWGDFTADMVEWLEWLVLWFSRLGLLLASLVALFGSAGTAAPAVWVFNVEANAAIESLHKWYKGLKAIGSGMSSMGVLAVTVGVVLPAYVEFSVELLGQSDLRDKAAVPLSLPPQLLDPHAFDLGAM